MSSRGPPYTPLSKSVKRGYKQHSGKYWRHYVRSNYRVPKRRGYLTPRSKAVGFTLQTKRQLKSKLPLGHYEDFLSRSSRPKTVRGGRTLARRRGGPKGGVAMGELGPKSIFWIHMHPSMKSALLSNKRKGVYNDIVKELKGFVKRVITHVQKELVGDPRVFGGGRDGLVPRGGTGYMRLITRSYLESQIRVNKAFPFNLNFKIPVKYAKPLNAMSTNQIQHTGQYGWRIVDYTPDGNRLKSRYKKVKLFDPSAIGGFFEKIITLAQYYAAAKFLTMLRRIIKYNDTALLGVRDRVGNQVLLGLDSFLYFPQEFKTLLVGRGIIRRKP